MLWLGLFPNPLQMYKKFSIYANFFAFFCTFFAFFCTLPIKSSAYNQPSSTPIPTHYHAKTHPSPRQYPPITTPIPSHGRCGSEDYRRGVNLCGSPPLSRPHRRPERSGCRGSRLPCRLPWLGRVPPDVAGGDAARERDFSKSPCCAVPALARCFLWDCFGALLV